MTGLGDVSSSAVSTRGLWHATTATLTLVALFWLGVATAGALVPGYAHRDGLPAVNATVQRKEVPRSLGMNAGFPGMERAASLTRRSARR